MNAKVCSECWQISNSSSEHLAHIATHALRATICTVCGEDNLAEEGCFNCKGMGECINCCGCLEPNEEEE